jgi:1,4-dihydroxy-2-naphthoate octaprenyltransferase
LSRQHRGFFVALRPFSLVVALATCSLGISLAALDGYANWQLSALVLAAGLLLQAGVNLINDYPDLAQQRVSQDLATDIVRNARLGALAIALACAIGVGFVWLRGPLMLALGAVGVLGAWSYADGPLNFKARGLGVVAVFFLTGVLMVEGAYFALTGRLSQEVVWLSVPFSLYASLLLLANELRDFERDVQDGHRTFSVRFGYRTGVALYRIIVLLLLATTLWLAISRDIPVLLLPVLALLLLWFPLGLLSGSVEERGSLTQLTGRCYLAFSLLFVAAFWIPVL